jgi:hypothetical protein
MLYFYSRLWQIKIIYESIFTSSPISNNKNFGYILTNGISQYFPNFLKSKF